MKLHITKQYYKRSQYGREPVKYTAKQPKGIGTDVYATIKIDPILRKKELKPIKVAMLRHEVTEIREWGKGSTKAHTIAKKKESQKLKKIGGVMDFWNKVKEVQ